MYFSRRRRHTRWPRDWSSDVCSSDLAPTDLRRHVPEPFEAEQLADEDEAVAGAQTLDEVLLHLSQHPLRTLEAHLHHRCRHDEDRKSVVKGKSVQEDGGRRTKKESRE